MVQGLRALAALPDDPGSFPAPTRQLTIICDTSARGSNTFLHPQAPGTQVGERRTCRQNAYTGKVKTKIQKLNISIY